MLSTNFNPTNHPNLPPLNQTEATDWIATNKKLECKISKKISARVSALEKSNIIRNTELLQQLGSKPTITKKWFNKVKGGNPAFKKIDNIKYRDPKTTGKLKIASSQIDLETQSVLFWEKPGIQKHPNP